MEAKNNLQHGDILFCWSNGIIGKGIRKVTSSRYNHVAIVLVIDGEVFIVDAQSRGVFPLPYENWMLLNGYEYEVMRYKYTSQTWGKIFRQRVLSKTGITGYDFLFLFLWYPLYLLTGKWYGSSEEKSEKRNVCSELAGWAYKIPEYWKLSPQDLYNFMFNSNLFQCV